MEIAIENSTGFQITERELKQLLSDCGFLDGISFRGVDDYLSSKILRLMLQWRFEMNQQKFERFAKSQKGKQLETQS